MRERSLYESLQCAVHPDGLEPAELLALELCLRDGGATVLTDSASSSANHIVCHPSAYHALVERREERFVALVQPAWVFRTFLLQRLLPVGRFSANPALFFSTLAIAAGPIAKDPRKVIDGLITHFGGQVVDQKKVYEGATHILSTDEPGSGDAAEEPEHMQLLRLNYSVGDVSRGMESWHKWLEERPTDTPFTLPSCVVAYMGKQAGLTTQHHVNYSWIEESVSRHSCVPEGPFACHLASTGKSSKRKPVSWKTRPEVQLEDLNASKCAQVYQLGRTELGTELSVVRKLSDVKLAAMENTLSGEIVLLAQHIAPLLRDKIAEVLKTVKAKVANVPLSDSYQEIVAKVVTNASYVVCRYRGGYEYEEALRQNKPVVSIYWVLAGHSPDSKPTVFTEAIQRPVKAFGGIPGMQSFVVTLSGYTSRTSPSREEIQVAIHATGACMLPVLSRTHSTHLLCLAATGEKYKKALSWGFENVLSHEWIFVCLKEWTHLAEEPFRCNSNKLPTTAEVEAGKGAKTKSAPGSEKENTDPTGKKKHGITDDDGDAEDSTSKVARKSKSSKAATPSGKGRFSVDGILTELDGVPTPTENNASTDDASTTSATAAKTTPSTAKSAACTLFDTPTTATKKGGKKGAKKSKKDDEPMPLAEEQAKEPEVEREIKAGGKEASRASNTNSDMEVLSGEPEANVSTANKASTKRKASSAKTTAAKKKRKATDPDETTAAASKAKESSATKKKKQKKTPAKDHAPAVAKSDFKFLLTGSREQGAVHASIISALGASMSQAGHRFDNNCTHIICSELKRTEKFVAGCAAGKWVLKPSFLEASSTAGRFVDETPHEWGALAKDKELMDARIWPEVPRFWREHHASGKPGAFAGWRVFIHSKCVPPSDMCERIVVAGGGSVLPLVKSTDLGAAAQESTEEAPVVALLPPDLPARDAWQKKLKTHGVECLKASFLIDFVTKEQPPDIQRADYHL